MIVLWVDTAVRWRNEVANDSQTLAPALFELICCLAEIGERETLSSDHENVCVANGTDEATVTGLSFVANASARDLKQTSHAVIGILVRGRSNPEMTKLSNKLVSDNGLSMLEEIRAEIVNFITSQDLPMVADSLLDELAMAFKGLTKFEIHNLLALAYSDDGQLTKGDLQLIFEQKKQLIMKSGILEMVKVKETIDDIGGFPYCVIAFFHAAKIKKYFFQNLTNEIFVCIFDASKITPYVATE